MGSARCPSHGSRFARPLRGPRAVEVLFAAIFFSWCARSLRDSGPVKEQRRQTKNGLTALGKSSAYPIKYTLIYLLLLLLVLLLLLRSVAVSQIMYYMNRCIRCSSF